MSLWSNIVEIVKEEAASAAESTYLWENITNVVTGKGASLVQYPSGVYLPARKYIIYSTDKRQVPLVTFSILMSEKHEYSSNVTTHRVQDGSVITDHIENDPRSGSIRGLVTNFSINTRGLYDTVSRLSQLNPSYFSDKLTYGNYLKDLTYLLGKGINIGVGGIGFDNAQLVYNTFRLIWENRKLVRITTGLEVYDNVAITKVAVDKDKETGHALYFDIDFKQVRTVSAQKIDVIGRANHHNSHKKKLGKKTAKSAKPTGDAETPAQIRALSGLTGTGQSLFSSSSVDGSVVSGRCF